MGAMSGGAENNSGVGGSTAAGGGGSGTGGAVDADLVATWHVPMSDRVYKVEFLHGTTTGKRIVRLNGKVGWVVRREFLKFCIFEYS